MAKGLISFRHEGKADLEKEAVEKGFKNLSQYMPTIVDNRHNTGGTVTDPKQAEKIKELEASCLKYAEQVNELKGRLAEKTTSGLAEHYAKRAWEIGRISKEKLDKGFTK